MILWDPRTWTVPHICNQADSTPCLWLSLVDVPASLYSGVSSATKAALSTMVSWLSPGTPIQPHGAKFSAALHVPFSALKSHVGDLTLSSLATCLKGSTGPSAAQLLRTDPTLAGRVHLSDSGLLSITADISGLAHQPQLFQPRFSSAHLFLLITPHSSAPKDQTPQILTQTALIDAVRDFQASL